MKLSDDLSMERLALRIIDRSLPKDEWTHEAHFAVALWLLRNRPELASAEEMRALITGYNDAAGTPNSATSGYHHTITLASMRAAGHHLAGWGAGTPLHVVLHSVMGSPLGGPDWLLAHWSRETLFSIAARQDWVEPDLLPLPF